ncbi:MAG TPA: Calx-beta domain-containing protein [Solirubrobacteraceae bacterium]|nr:Calx-beta domain-containing protein [Solirubrobacteraceae bacterium]
MLVAPAAAQASISVGDISLSEGNGGAVATFTLTRNAALLSGGTSVAFATVDGSARAPADYAARSGNVSFGSALLGGTQVQTVSVPVAGDRLDEPNETFRLVLSGAEVAAGDATATIVDDDAPPAVSVGDAAPATEGGTAAFPVALNSPSGRDVTVTFATANASAVAGQDYTARSGTLTIPAGATTAAVAVALTDDSIDEPAEAFELRLSAPVNATLGDAAGTATIIDNDEPPPAAPPAPAPAAPVTVAPVLPTLPVTGSSGTSSSVTVLGVGTPRLRPPGTGLITLTCPQALGTCTGQVTLFSRPNKRSKLKDLRKERRLGQRAFSLGAGQTVTLTFALSRADRRLLERSGRIDVRAYAINKDAAGHSSVRTASGTLVRRTAHSRSAARGEGLDEVGGALGAVVGGSPGL